MGMSKEILTLMTSIKDCTKNKNLSEGIHLHEYILKVGLLGKNPYLASSLISMYAKCGALAKAQEVLECLSTRDVVSWSALIAGYTLQEQGVKALHCFDQMQKEGLAPDAVTYSCILKACGDTGNLEKGKKMHKEIVRTGIAVKDIVLGTALVDMYAKCGVLSKAQNVLEGLLIRNVVSWNALISGYAQHGQYCDALNCYEQMQKEGISPNAVTFTCVLKACGNTQAFTLGKQIHEEIANRGFLKRDIVLGNALVDMYAKCGMLVEAQQLLIGLPDRTVVSWSTLIAEYAEHGQYGEALNCFEMMQREGFLPNLVTYVCILKVCGRTAAVHKGKQIHKEIVNRGLLKNDIVLRNALIDMYAKCGMFANALEVLREIPVRDIVSWGVLIAGYAEQGQCHEALDCLKQMQREGLSPNSVILISILKACGNERNIDKGKEIHDEIMNRGLLEKDIVLGTALVDMYMKCDMVLQAEQVLKELPVRDAATWSALIAGYVQHGQGIEALNCFEQMQNEGLIPDGVNFICILKACGVTGSIGKGKEIHESILSRNLLEKDIILGTALVDMYAKCGLLSKAEQLLKELPARDVVSWSVLIAGYVQHGQNQEALNCFQQMQSDGFSPDGITFISILKACGSIGAVQKGKHIHDYIINRNMLTKDVVLGSALVDMYAKCGAPVEAWKAMEELPIRNTISWSSLIAGYAQQGQGHEALNCIELMQIEGHSPDGITLLSVLSACSHSSLLDDAQILFGDMARKYGITPCLEHHTCMIVNFGYAGHFEKAISVINVMPSTDYSVIWLALMGACRKWGNVKLGRLAFDQMVQLDDSCAAAYVLMGSIFAAAGMDEDAEGVETMRQKCAVWNNDENCARPDAGQTVHFSLNRDELSQSMFMYSKGRSVVFRISTIENSTSLDLPSSLFLTKVLESEHIPIASCLYRPVFVN